VPDFSDVAVLLSRIRALEKRGNTPPKPGGSVLPGQRVQIEAGREVFVVLRVDHQRHLADLLRPGAVRKVPLVLLTLADEPQAMDEMKVSA
jgi:hypothetical protein